MKLPKRLMLLSLAMLTYASCVEAQTYLCIADMATGFRFDKSTKAWVVAQFDVTDEKYILAKEGDEWIWKKVGELVDLCREKKDFNAVGAFGCDFGAYSQLLMNRNTLRFQIISPELYVGPFDRGEVEGANTPHVEIGKCAITKLIP